MKTDSPWSGALLALAMLLALVSGCSAPTQPTVAPSGPVDQPTESAQVPLPDMGPLVVGYMPVLAYAPLFVAVEKGYLQEQGFEIELQSFRSGSYMIAPLSTGLIDAGAGETGTALFNAIALELDVRVVGALSSQPTGYGAVPLLVRKDLFDSGEISSPADLKGRRVALNVERGMAEYLLAEALAQAALSVDDVQLVTLPFPDVPAALENRAVDAAILPHPLAAKAIGSGSAAVLLEGDSIVDTPQNGVLYFGQRLLDPANREAGVRFLVAYLKAARDLQGDGWRSDANATILNKYTNVPTASIQAGVAYYSEPNGEINRSSTERIQQYLVGRGYTEVTEPLPLSEFIDDSFMTEALERLGRFER